MDGNGDTRDAPGGASFSITDPPPGDVRRYAVVYPLVVVAVAVGLSVVYPAAAPVSLVGLGILIATGGLLSWWVTRTGDVGGHARVDARHGVTHVLTTDARQRLRIILFTAGIFVQGVLGLAAVLWLTPDLAAHVGL